MNREQMITHLTLLGYYPVLAGGDPRFRALSKGDAARCAPGVHEDGPWCTWWIRNDEVPREWALFTDDDLRTILENIDADPSLEP